MVRTRNKPLLLKYLLAAGMLLTATSFAVPAAGKRITVYITDFGINQWHDKLTMGADFTHVTNRVLPQAEPKGQIVVPMPSDRELATLSAEELTQQIVQAVIRRVDAGINSNSSVTTFEIQLVENMNAGGYLDPERQHKVDAFGAAAYTAIGRVIDQLHANRIETSSYAIVGSNGTKVLAANVESLLRHGKSYLQGVDLFDGRAFLTPVAHLIEAVGPAHVRIFNTRTDWPAPYTPFGFRSIANFSTVADLKAMYPQLKTYVLLPKVPIPNPLLSHIAGMAKQDTHFGSSTPNRGAVKL